MNPISVNPMAVVDLPLEGQLAVFESLDVDHFGLTVSTCAEYGWDETLHALEGVRPSLAYLCHGPSASADDLASWQEESQLIRQAVDFAARAGTPMIYFTTGRQGRLVWEDAAVRVGAHLAELAKFASDKGVQIVLENSLSIRSDISFTHSVRDTARLAAIAEAQLCVDLYCCAGEAGLATTLAANLERIAMVQISDMRAGDLALPNRRVPGEGDLPLVELLAIVRNLGYRGLVDVELIGPEIAREGAEAALVRSLDWVRARLS